MFSHTKIPCFSMVFRPKAERSESSPGATGAARWVALGRPEVDAMQVGTCAVFGVDERSWDEFEHG